MIFIHVKRVMNFRIIEINFLFSKNFTINFPISNPLIINWFCNPQKYRVIITTEAINC